MKVNIGPYVNYVGPYQIAKALFFWTEEWPEDEKLEERWDYRAKDRLGDWLAGTFVKDACDWINDRKKRRVEVKIDRYDVWSMDHTLAYIILPMLKRLQEVKHGSPSVDDEDVPEHLRSTAAPPRQAEWDTDDNHHKRWEWVLSEMIWAFEQILDDDADSQFYTGEHHMLWQKVDKEGNKIGDPVEMGSFKKSDDKDADVFYEWISGPNDTHKFDREGYQAWSKRKANGFLLFGKYYQGLWN